MRDLADIQGLLSEKKWDRARMLPKIVKALESKINFKSGLNINVTEDMDGRRNIVYIEGKLRLDKGLGTDTEKMWAYIEKVGKRNGADGIIGEDASYDFKKKEGTVRIRYVYRG